MPEQQYTENIDAVIYSEAFGKMDEQERIKLIAAILDQMGVNDRNAKIVTVIAEIEAENAKL